MNDAVSVSIVSSRSDSHTISAHTPATRGTPVASTSHTCHIFAPASQAPLAALALSLLPFLNTWNRLDECLHLWV